MEFRISDSYQKRSPKVLESPSFQHANDQANSTTSNEVGHSPDDSLQQRGEEEDKVPTSPLKQTRISRKKKFREISVTDIMPNIKSKLRSGIVESELKVKPKINLINLVKIPTFWSYLEVSDYLEIRKGCKNMQDYTILEQLIKFGNLNDSLRANLWVNVCSPLSVQNKYRRELNIGSVFVRVYNEVLENFSDSTIKGQVEAYLPAFREYKQSCYEYDPDDVDVARNLTVAFMSLFEHVKSKQIPFILKLTDTIFQGARDEELSFWILMGIVEDDMWRSWLCKNEKSLKTQVESLTLNLLIEKFCPQLHKLMEESNQIKEICDKVLKSMACNYFGKYHTGLTIIDSYLVCGWKGFYERLIIMLSHLESFIDSSSSVELHSIRNDKSSSIDKYEEDSQKVHFTEPIEPQEFKIDPESLQGRSRKLSLTDLELAEKDEFNFQNIINSICDFNCIYEVSITDKDLAEIRKEAIDSLVLSSDTDSKLIDSLNNEDAKQLEDLKQKLQVSYKKYKGDITNINAKKHRFRQNIQAEMDELNELEANYQCYMQAFEHLKEKISILKDTQAMLYKEIWKKKQILKIMYTNKSFRKTKPSNAYQTSSNTFDYGHYGYGKGICYTEEMEPADDFMYDHAKSKNKKDLNSSFGASQRGLAITQSMTKKTIQEEAAEIKKLQADVENLEEKIEAESECFDLYYSKYEEAKVLYEDKKSGVDDLSEFINCLNLQVDALSEAHEAERSNTISSLTKSLYSSLYEEVGSK